MNAVMRRLWWGASWHRQHRPHPKRIGCVDRSVVLIVSALTGRRTCSAGGQAPDRLGDGYAEISPSRRIEASARSCGNPGHWQRMMK
jgi:hypothetical protein